jgi:hypothetical protein
MVVSDRPSQVVSLVTPQAALPDPFSPHEADLRAFGFMPLDVGRLRRSKTWLIAKRRPQIGFYAMNLWMESWHQLPAGSLEPDDDLLADMAMCPPDQWAEVRDDVMRGWTLCSDGRLYHPVVAEKVNEAWEMRRAHSDRARARAARRWSKNNNDLPPDTQPVYEGKAELSPPPDDTGGMHDACTMHAGCITSGMRQDKTGQDKTDSVSSLRSDTGEAAMAAPPPRAEEIETPQPSPDIPPDPNELLWSVGVRVVARITKKTEAASRKLIGLWLKIANGDPVLVLTAIREAREKSVLEPESWLVARLKASPGAVAPQNAGATTAPAAVDYGPDWQACRNRARPWFAEMAKLETRTGRWAVGGCYFDAVENRVLEAAKLPFAWAGDTKPIAEWLADGWGSDAIARVVADIAARHGYRSPRSLRFFDAAVRAAPKDIR